MCHGDAAARRAGIFEGGAYPVDAGAIVGAARNVMRCVKGRGSSTFVDPADPSAIPIEWQGRWRTLSQAWTFAPAIENFTTAWSQLNFPRLLFNTAAVAILSTLGAVLSSALVAYVFARYRFPGKQFLFVILNAPLILPFQVTLLHHQSVLPPLVWYGTWLPSR